MKAHKSGRRGCLGLTREDSDDAAELAQPSDAGVPLQHAANLGDRNGALQAMQAPLSEVQMGTERESERWTGAGG